MNVFKHFTLYTFVSVLFASILFLTSCGSDDELEDPVVVDGDSFALRIGGSENDETKSAMDGEGNIIMAGLFNGTMTVGDQQLISAGDADIFIVKYKSNGDLVWAKRAGGSSYNDVLGMHVDAAGNVYITGELSGSATFDNTTITSTAYDNDLYVAKYNSTGNLVWVILSGGNIGGVTGLAVTTDASSNVYLTGALYGKANFGGTTLTSAGSFDIFVAKYNSSGSAVWARRAGGTDSDDGITVAVDASGNTFIGGHFRGTANFEETSLVSSGGADVFVAKYNSYGNLSWVKKAGGIKDDYAQDMKNVSGSIIVTGSFHNTANFNGTELTAAGTADDAFTAKYSSSGELNWVKQLSGASGYEGGQAVFVDASGQSYVTGIFASATATDGVNTITGAGNTDIFITKYSSTGEPLWSKSAGLATAESGRGISVDAKGYVYVSGMFNATTKLGSQELVSAGKADIFLWKFKP